MPSIVLAEPSAPVAGVLRRYLESAGHAVSWVGSVDEALRTVREQSPAILLASAMGALDGEALCRSVRAEGLATPVLLLYSPDEEQADTRAAEVGADGCLVGPLKRATVLTCVSLLVQREEARRRVATLSGLPPPLPVRPPPPPPLDDDADGLALSGDMGRMPPPPPLDDAAGTRDSAEGSTPGDIAGARASAASPLGDEGTASEGARASSVPPPLPGATVASEALAPELDAEPITSPSSEVDSDARDAVMVSPQAADAPGAADDDGLPLLHAEPEPDAPSVVTGVIVEEEAAEPSSVENAAPLAEAHVAGDARSADAPHAAAASAAASDATGASASGPEALPATASPSVLESPGTSGVGPTQPATVSSSVLESPGTSGSSAAQSAVRAPDAGPAAPAPVAGSRMSGSFPALASTPVPDGRRISRSDLASVGSHPDFEFLKRLMLMEVKRSRRYRYPIAVLLVDIDRFAEKAASLAPAARKLALAEAMGLLVSGVRDIDVAVPFADSRFVVFLPHTPRSGALVVGQRLRELIKSLQAFEGASASVGVAVSEPPPGRGPVAGALAQVSFGSLLKEAGEALRRAQAAGGDWVEAASGRTQPG
ncbi:diguanylate cyclase [Myxococcus hansupus]|nr:diguanylate cyclase [Myxococcus hansupus]